MKQTTVAALVAAAVLVATALAISSTSFDAPARPIPAAIAGANNGFAIDFYRQISDNGENIFFSPASVFVAFSMLYEGAADATADQMAQAFGFEPDAATRHDLIRAYLSSINSGDGHAALEMANSAWLAEWFDPYDSYADVVRGVYLSVIETADFADPDDGIARVNGWVSENTRGKITELLAAGDVGGDTALVLANAMYFKGAWADQFPKENTRDGDFWTGPSESVRAEMMVTSGEFRYLEADGARILELPYEGGRLSMLVALPDARDGIGGLEQDVSAGALARWTAGMDSREVLVEMPKFTLEPSYDLADPLRALGVSDVFDEDESDLSRMAADPLYVSTAVHKAYVTVDEEGTVAAASTGIGVSESSAAEVPHFKADHPFLFFIQDGQSGAVLFMGRVSDPSQ